jgi:gamma-glutamyltranspeptidase/glutathione hydrolase
MVSATQSLSLHFGSGIVAPGTGVILNDTMDDFSYANPKAVNFVAAGKRPRSTTSPSVVFRQGKPILAIGLPGAGRIPTAMLQVMVDYLAFHRPLAQAIGDTRLHLPGPVAGQAVANVWETEDSLPDPVADGLRSRRWRVVKKEPAGTGGYFGGFNAIEIQADGTLVGFADPRRSNAAVGY